ncbi:MAG TPA: TolC family protein [bacterium]
MVACGAVWAEQPAVPEEFTVDDVSRLALARNLNVSVLRIDRDIRREDIRIARSPYDTTLSVLGEYEIDETQPSSTIFGSRTVHGALRTTIEQLLPMGTRLALTHSASRESTQSPFSSLSRYYEGSGGVSVTQPVFRNAFGLIDRGQLKLVKLDVARFDFATQDRIEAEVFGARQEYWELVFADQDLAAKRGALSQAEDFLRAMREKRVLGLAEEQDVLAAEANVRLRVLDVLEAETALEGSRDRLRTLLDLPEGLAAAPADQPVFEEIAVSVEESLARALVNRRDLRQLALETDRADLETILARSGLQPQLDLEAAYRSNGLDRELFDAQGKIGGGNHPTTFAGFTFSVPLENRKAKAQYRQAKLQERRVELLERELRLRIEQEIRDAVRALRLAAERVRQTREVAALQQRKLTQESRAFRLGRSDSRTVIDYQEDVIDSDAALARALVGYRLAQDTLWRAEHRLMEAAGLFDADIAAQAE